MKQKKKHFKSVLMGLTATFALLSLVGAGWYFYQKSLLSTESDELSFEKLWVTKTPAPATVEPGAYLAALNAVMNEDLKLAADFYLKTLAGDIQNEELQQEAYFINAMLGDFEALRPIVDKIKPENQEVLLTDYVKAAYAIKDGNWQKMSDSFAEQRPLLADKIWPLLQGWRFVAEGQAESAYQAIAPLKEKQGFSPYYHYHRGLMALVLNQADVADESFRQMAEQGLITVSYYPEIKAFYELQGRWNIENPLFVKGQLFQAEQPATAELIMQPASRRLTAVTGAAEVFYNMATALGFTKKNYETTLVLSALSDYLNPNQNLPKVWAAEILEQVEKPQLAQHYYNRITGPLTQTIAFKKAMNLLACHQEAAAEYLLNKLKPTNPDSTPLWVALASVYQAQKKWHSAESAYTHLIKIADETNRPYLAHLYFSRALIYSEQKKMTLAEQDLMKALELNPESPDLLNHLGYYWLETGKNVVKGYELVQKAYQLKKNEAHIIDSMAFAHYLKKEYDKALPLAERAVDEMPQSSVANAHLGDIYAALGRGREAVFQYRKALALKYDLTEELKQELAEKIGDSEKDLKIVKK